MYKVQYDRMIRWYKRFEAINMGRSHDMVSDNYQDEIYAFFITCYHLKDWLINDSRLSLNKNTIEKFVNSNEYLKICADICNGIKHLLLTNPRVGTGAKIGNRNFALNLGASEIPIISVRYIIETDNEKYDAFEVATESIQAWDKFLNESIKSYVK